MQDNSEQARVPAIGDFRFTTEYREDPKKPGEMMAEDWVSWIKIGDAHGSRTSEKIVRLQPNPVRNRPAAVEWRLIEAAYEAWKKGQEIPIDGTPIEAWPGCDQKLAEALKGRNVRTIEQFAEVPDHYLSGIPIPDLRRRQQLARDFLKAKEGQSQVAAELAKRDQIIEKLMREVEELKGGGEDKPKRGPGRPPKVQAEAEEAA